MPITREDLQSTLQAAFPNAKITLNDLAGDNDHWSAEIVDDAFKGLSRIAQHKLVQNVVKDKNIHALQIKTSTNS